MLTGRFALPGAIRTLFKSVRGRRSCHAGTEPWTNHGQADGGDPFGGKAGPRFADVEPRSVRVRRYLEGVRADKPDCRIIAEHATRFRP